MPKNREAARANLENLYRIFTVPEAPHSNLGEIDQAITEDLAGFLQTHIVALERSLEEIEGDFASSRIPEEPTFVSEYTEFVKEKLVAQSVHTAAPGFVGHMTSALPYFMLPLSRIMTALNQNLVKVETSKAFTPLERQVLAMLHRLVYHGDDDFYARWIHDSRHALGAFCSGGTIANVTALWVARNRLFAPTEGFGGIAREGMVRALKRLRDENIRPLALVGIAGTTETGNIDPLDAMADVAQALGCHFHVDAAWGGPTLFSERHRHLLRGIDRADSVTIDAHKQLYVPMGAGMVVFKDPTALTAIEHHAAYILRHGSKDLGSHTLEGSRPGKALLVHAGMSIIGRKGYELLIDLGLEKARTFADMIRKHPDFELTSAPELNILTYRYCPAEVQEALVKATKAESCRINALLDQVNQLVQKIEREAGKTFVSRTRLRVPAYGCKVLTVFRVVLANPLTTEEILSEVLAEQCEIVREPEIRALLDEIKAFCAERLAS
ncbi:MAG: pyridoxal-dependent decarboxylase [Desulfuromonadales bacterium]